MSTLRLLKVQLQFVYSLPLCACVFLKRYRTSGRNCLDVINSNPYNENGQNFSWQINSLTNEINCTMCIIAMKKTVVNLKGQKAVE